MGGYAYPQAAQYAQYGNYGVAPQPNYYPMHPTAAGGYQGGAARMHVAVCCAVSAWRCSARIGGKGASILTLDCHAGYVAPQQQQQQGGYAAPGRPNKQPQQPPQQQYSGYSSQGAETWHCSLC